MMADMEQLKTIIAGLKEQQKGVYELLKTMQASEAKESPEVHTKQPLSKTRQLVVPNEQKFSKCSSRQRQ